MRIEDMSIDQLLELNPMICRRIDELQDQENLQALSRLHVGLKVTFESRTGLTMGIVTKINRKSVIVLAEERHETVQGLTGIAKAPSGRKVSPVRRGMNAYEPTWAE
ncbi:hypothetical protein SSTU70S_02459 [Stutzerimonas stutzeri]